MTSAADPPFRPLPADVDLTSMDFFPLHDQRLMRSRAWLRAKSWRGEGPGLGFVLMNLWLAAFRAVPAGSIEDDEDYLADVAQVAIEHWRAAKEKALNGWVLIGGRWHHPVVSAIAGELWKARLKSRHEATQRSWKASAKRAMDAGQIPPAEPGDFEEWCGRDYPATAAWLSGVSVTRTPADPNMTVTLTPDGNGMSVTNGNFDGHKSPKQSKGKFIPPDSPPLAAAGTGKGADPKRAKPSKAGRVWFEGERDRLKTEFGALWPRLAASVRTASNQPPEYALVVTFKGAWLDHGGANPVLVMPSKQRADALVARFSETMKSYGIDIAVRHAKVDELRARREAKANG